MKKGNTKIVLLEVFLILIFFFALFAPRIVARYVVALILVVTTLIIKNSFRIKNNEYIYSRQVKILMLLLSLVYVAAFFGMGLYFGFLKAAYKLSINTFLRFILPFTVIIIFTEYLRKILLSQEVYLKIKSKKINISTVLTFLITVLIDMFVYIGIYDVSTLENTLRIIGFVIFASISCNLLYQYVTKRFGPDGIVVYRLVTILYPFIIPFEPNVFVFLRSFLRMIYPFIIYIILENTYAKSNLALSYKQRKRNIVTTTITLIFMTLLIMLISCKFKYGIIVIGSESMTGTINKGDAVVFERYDDGNLKVGQVIIFEKNNMKIIHRIYKVTNNDGEIQIYTKGDANKEADKYFVKKSEVMGLVKLKVKYIGRPTLWVNDLFTRR